MYVNYMKTIKERYLKLGYQPYRWFHAGEDPAPFTPLYKKIKNAGGTSFTSGAYSLGQSAYHYKDDSSLEVSRKTVRRKIFGFLISQRTTLRTLEKIRIAFCL